MIEEMIFQLGFFFMLFPPTTTMQLHNCQDLATYSQGNKILILKRLLAIVVRTSFSPILGNLEQLPVCRRELDSVGGPHH